MRRSVLCVNIREISRAGAQVYCAVLSSLKSRTSCAKPSAMDSLISVSLGAKYAVCLGRNAHEADFVSTRAFTPFPRGA